MPESPEVSISERPPSTPDADEALNLVCHEVWGGHRDVRSPIRLPGVRGLLFSKACDGGEGGDLHYLSVCGSGLLSRICLADVAGHGREVANTSALMHGHLRKCINHVDQRRVLRGLNRRLADGAVTPMATAAMLTYFPPTRKLSYSYAGHEPAWYQTAADRAWRRLSASPRRGMADLPLAVLRDTAYSHDQKKVGYGDRVLLLTDGVIEAPNPEGELFGREKVGQVIRRHAQDDCPTIADALLTAVYEHCGSHRLMGDDVSLLMLEFVEEPGSPALLKAIWNRITRPKGNADSFIGGPSGERY